MNISGLFVRRGLVTSQQLDLAKLQASGRRVDQVLVDMGIVPEHEALQAIAEELGMEFRDLKNYQVNKELLNRFPTTAIFRHELLPLEAINGRISVATSDPFDLEALDELGRSGGLPASSRCWPAAPRSSADQRAISASAATRSANWSRSAPKRASNCSTSCPMSSANWPRWRRQRRSSSWSTKC